MPHTITKEAYNFEELDDNAKEKAREWYRGTDYPYYEWWDCSVDNFKDVLGTLGYHIDQVYFSGFCSQGDGACFTGTWYSSDVNPEKAKAYITDWPTDKDLHGMINSMLDLISKHPHGFSASIKHIGHYYHEHCVHIDVDNSCEEEDCEYDHESFGDEVIEISRDLMRWIYSSLEKEYEWLMSDECVDTNLIENEYEFTKQGYHTS